MAYRSQIIEAAINVANDILPLMGSECHTGLQMSQCLCANATTVAAAEIFDTIKEQAFWNFAKQLGQAHSGKSYCQNAIQCQPQSAIALMLSCYQAAKCLCTTSCQFWQSNADADVNFGFVKKQPHGYPTRVMG